MRPLPSEFIRKALLLSGIFSSLLYAVINIVVARQWDAYDPAGQTVSELSAIGAPTRTLWTILCIPYTLLMIAFSWGVLRSARGVLSSARANRLLHLSAILLLAYSLLGIFWPFAPMHLREKLAAGGGTFSDTLHIALGVVTELIYLAVLGLTAAALGATFRIYSILTLTLLLIFGWLTFASAPGIGAGQPTPLIGIWERINIGIFLLWVIVLAIYLLRIPQK